MADVKTGDTVVPGDPLCVIEELTPSFGTYEADGIVYAATAGEVNIDLKKRSIMVLSQNGEVKLSLPVKGDILIGEVVNVYEQRAEVSLVKRNDRVLFSPLLGEIYISNVTRRFVKSMHDVLGPTDIVRAIALNTHEIPVHLSLVGPDLGVIFSKCPKCGSPLTVTTYNNMICLKCENRVTREVAKDYGLMFGLEQRQDLAPRRKSYGDRRSRSDYRTSDRDGSRRHGPRRSFRGGDARDTRRSRTNTRRPRTSRRR